MIPKVIHYCWFGRNPKPKLFKKCLKSWKKYCPDYKIVEWNEDNFDISSNLYTKQAYENKKWAFVTDYVRLYALYNFGGVYMDTDVEVVKPIDEFLKHEAFSGFENQTSIPTGIMGAEKGNPLFKQLLDYYTDKAFIVDGEMDMITNVATITKMLSDKGFIPNNNYQVVEGFALYPFDYFCPHDYETGVLNVTNNTYTIHHFAGSWLPEEIQKEDRYRFRVANLQRKYGERVASIYGSYHRVNQTSGLSGVLKYTMHLIRGRFRGLSK